MLEGMRRSIKGWFATIFILLLASSFALWGISGAIFTGLDLTVAKIDDVNISARQYRTEFDRQILEYRQRNRQSLSRAQAREYGLDQQILRNIIERTLLDLWVQEYGIAASDARVWEIINEIPDFQDSLGNFDQARFVETLQQNNVSAKIFFETSREQINRQQFVQSVQAGIAAPAKLGRIFMQYQYGSRDIGYYYLDENDVGAAQIPDADAILAYYAENQEAFRQPELRNLSVLRIIPEDITDSQSISSEEIAVEYQARRDSFFRFEKRSIDQLLFASEQEARQAREKLSASDDFYATARELGYEENDIRIENITKGELINEIDELSFGLAQGELSDVVETPFGWAIIRILQITPQRTISQEEAEETLRQEIAGQRAREKIYEISTKIDDLASSGANLAEIAGELALRLLITGPVQQDGQGIDERRGEDFAKIPDHAFLLEEAFRSDFGELAPINYEKDGGIHIFEVTEIIESAIPPQAELREEISEILQKQEIAQKLSESAKEQIAKLLPGFDAKQIAKIATKPLQQLPDITRFGAPGDMGESLISKVFSADIGDFVTGTTADRARQMVVWIKKINAPDFAALHGQQQRLLQELSPQFQNEMLVQLTRGLVQRTDIVTYQNAIDAAHQGNL